VFGDDRRQRYLIMINISRTDSSFRLPMSLRKLRALVLGHDQPPDNIYTTLTASGIPVASADCRTCPNPCDEGNNSQLALARLTHIFQVTPNTLVDFPWTWSPPCWAQSNHSGVRLVG
jgi:hypothetical protein